MNLATWNFAPLPEEPPDDLTEEAPAGLPFTSVPASPLAGLLPALDPWACPTCGGNPCRYSCYEEE